ncbi:MAG TPA: hypothetical protein DCL77_04115 [Prolixibacteraceae bacterium]|jgi:hypothetical protein|nr:hypothetical protein [Prolixibacteraceae bacterium]
MKKNQLLYVFATLVIGVALFFSCQKAEVVNGEQELKLKSASNCSVCVPNWMDSKASYSGWIKFNSTNAVPSTFLDVWNDNAQVHYTVYRTSGTFTEVRVNGIMVISGDAISTYSWAVALNPGWKACDQIITSIELRGVSGGTGRTNNPSFTYYLREKCVGCTESFNYTDNGNKTYTFTYTPAEDLVDQPVAFTFAQGVVVTGLGEEWVTAGNTRQKTMSFTKCMPVVWTLSLQANCSGNSSQSNVWTDFKVNNVSKKGELSNITQTCP